MIAVGVSIFNLSLTRKQLYASIVTKNRMTWMEQMRTLLHSFIELCLSPEDDLVKAGHIVAHIDLYMSPKDNPTHRELSTLLHSMLDGSDVNIEPLVECSQKMFAETWDIIKLESNIDLKQAKSIARQVYLGQTV